MKINTLTLFHISCYYRHIALYSNIFILYNQNIVFKCVYFFYTAPHAQRKLQKGSEYMGTCYLCSLLRIEYFTTPLSLHAV